jgi:hypothetical protein
METVLAMFLVSEIFKETRSPASLYLRTPHPDIFFSIQEIESMKGGMSDGD